MAQLNARQQQILDFVREYHLDRSYMPSVREIQTACDISSTSVVDYNLRILEREGMVRRSTDISRGLELVGAYEAHADANVSNIEVFQIPVVGTIAAGAPIPVPESDGWRSEGSETITLPSELVTRCLDLMGGVRVSGETHESLVEYAKELKTMRVGTGTEGVEKDVNVLDLLQMVVATVDYQFA